MYSFRLTHNTATEHDIYKHLLRCSDQFIPPLSVVVNIDEYAKKIASLADTIEVWDNNNLIGLVAIYLNDRVNKRAFITNVSTDESVQGLGIAKDLLHQAFGRAIALGFKFVLLEVGKDNLRAIALYKKAGFLPSFERNGFVGMHKEL